MKLYATGDTHGNFERFRPEYFPKTDPDPVIQHYPFWKRWFDVK